MERLFNFNRIFKNVLTEDVNYFDVGQSVRFDIENVSKYNQDNEIGFGYGMITGKTGDIYEIRLDNGQTIKVKNTDAYSSGGSDATPSA